MSLYTAPVQPYKPLHAGSAPPSQAVAFDGTSLSVDYATYLSQHDVVYLTPPQQGTQAMPLGDGDLGAMLWCPGHLQLQVQKSDLWDDPASAAHPETIRDPSAWRLLSAGGVALHTQPILLRDLYRFEQRLSLYSGVVSIQADSPAGACQVTAFVAATAGVLVVHYQDQTLRLTERGVEVSLWRPANLFALGETIGILQAMSDRRYALIARVQGQDAAVRMCDAHTARIDIAPSRSCSFTLYIAVATCPRDGDPIIAAKARLQAAMNQGYETLLREHKQHWAMFWQKSFLRLDGEDDDTAAYLENLWYLNLYHQAACSRGYDAPLSNGGLWLNEGDSRSGPAIYRGEDLRASLASLLASNHLELSVPIVDTYHRLLPEVAARTGQQFGVGGARFPDCFNRFGQECKTKGIQVFRCSGVQEKQWPTLANGTQPRAESRDSEPEDLNTRTPEHLDIGDGLYTALLIWQAWRYAPDPFFLRERAYPLLRACTIFALEHVLTVTGMVGDELELGRPVLGEEMRSALGTALRALLWASEELELDAGLRAEWRAGLQWLGGETSPYKFECTLPLGELCSEEAVTKLRAWIQELPQREQGWFAPKPHTPYLHLSGQVGAAISALLLREEPANGHSVISIGVPERAEGFGGMPSGVLQIFASLPPMWNAAFNLAAPGGFRICAEAIDGKARYVAVRSLLGGVCRIANPWGAGIWSRVVDGRQVVFESDAAVLDLETRRGGIYLIERADSPLGRVLRIRLRGRRNELPKILGSRMLGLNSVVSGQ